MLLESMLNQPLLYILIRNIPDRADLHKLYGYSYQALEAIAQALVSDSRWASVESPAFIIRSHPSPVIAIMGYLDAEQRARIESLQSLLIYTLHHLRYVDYQQAERDCEQLAARLVEAIGENELAQYHFAAIPRGGLIVLGMLSYTLNLKPSQLVLDPYAPLVVVDDCSITGLRFGEYVESIQNQRVIFAPLYAPRELLQAITAREPRVEACVSAQAMEDYAPMYFRERYQAWHTRLHERRGKRRYWTGMPEHICFAWNEPDNGYWNPVTSEEELGWRLVPNEFCLKNRVTNRQPTATIQHQPDAQGDLQPTDNVLFGALDDQIVVANIETGVNLCLSDVAADMWRAIIAAPNMEIALQELLNLYDTDAATLRADLTDFVTAMQEQGILAQ